MTGARLAPRLRHRVGAAIAGPGWRRVVLIRRFAAAALAATRVVEALRQKLPPEHPRHQELVRGLLYGADATDAMALAGALHGEFVVQTQDGGTQTERLQTGSVTAVAAGSMSVTSTDGFAATYVIGSDVDVSGVAVGDTVRVIATVDGDTVTATSVQSATGAMPGQGAGTGELPGGTAPTAAPQTS